MKEWRSQEQRGQSEQREGKGGKWRGRGGFIEKGKKPKHGRSASAYALASCKLDHGKLDIPAHKLPN